MGREHTHALHHHGHSVVHRLAPEAKVAAALATVLAVAVTGRGAWPAFAWHAAVVVGLLAAARLPVRFLLSRLVVALPFLLLAATIPFVAVGEPVRVGWASVSREGLVAGGTIAAKTLLGVSVSLLLAGTTEEPRILAGLGRLRFPVLLTTIATLMLRYLAVTADELRRTRTAMAARGYAPRWIGEAGPMARATGALFVRSYERGERVHAAMLSRGFTGRMPVLDADRATARDWALAAVPVVATAAAALWSWTSG